MKSLLSLALMLAPICAVVLLSGRDWERKRLRSWGLAGMASSACTYIGARFFGLYALGRTSTLEGDIAQNGAQVLFILSAGMVAGHYLIEGIKRLRHPRAPRLP